MIMKSCSNAGCQNNQQIMETNNQTINVNHKIISENIQIKV